MRHLPRASTRAASLRLARRLAPGLIAVLLAPHPGAGAPRAAPAGPSGPPSVGVAPVQRRAVTASSDYVGRIEAIDRVALVSRVTAFLDRRLFQEGSEVHKGDLLYVLEQGPFQAQLLAQQGALAQAQANVGNARVNFQRQAALLSTPAGQRQAYDNAQATAQGNAASVLTAQGNLQSAQIQLAYTEIRAPVDGRISATSVNEGNVVSPSSGTLATIVTQDPIYVTFPVSTRDVLTLQKKYRSAGGLAKAPIRLTLGDGSFYDQPGALDYVSPTVATQTDTITLRATVPNPKRGQQGSDGVGSRELVDGEFVTVTVQDPQAVQEIVIPRAAVLSDQQGNYVFVVDAQNHAQRADISLGESSGTDAVVQSGLADGQRIVVDGLQRVHAGGPVVPKPPLPPPPSSGTEAGTNSGAPAGASPAASNAAKTQGSATGSPAPAPNSAPNQR